MRTTLKAIGYATTVAMLAAMLTACGPDDRYDNPGADQGVGAGVGAGATTTVPAPRP
jgi:hypothetical protein